jgi:hypothetical protein
VNFKAAPTRTAHGTITKEWLALTRLFASLAFDEDDVETQKWIERRFAMLSDILRNTYISKRDREAGREAGREEERQAHLQVQRNALMTIIQARFPKLSNLALTQANQIQDTTLLENVIAELGSARTLKEARHALRNWQQMKQNN